MPVVSAGMRVQIVDPSAYTPPYDHALSAALASEGVDVELVTSEFGYGDIPPPDGYKLTEFFYRHVVGDPGSKVRAASKALTHIPDMLRYRRHAKAADLVHFQWLSLQAVDVHLLPKQPTVITAHDVLPREPRPGAVKAQRRLYEAVNAVIVHTEHGRERLIGELSVDPAKITVIPHGSFDYLTRVKAELPPELSETDRPVVLFFGLIRPYKGLDLLLEAWQGINDAELWVVGMPKMPIDDLRKRAPENVKFVSRFTTDGELAACFNRADIVTLPYKEIDQSGVLYTALAFNKPMVLSDVGGFPEFAKSGVAELFPTGDVGALASRLNDLLADDNRRKQMSSDAKRAAETTYSWDAIAKRTAELYASLL